MKWLGLAALVVCGNLGIVLANEPEATIDEALLQKLLGEEPDTTDPVPSLDNVPARGSKRTSEQTSPAETGASPAAVDAATVERLLARLKHAEKSLADGETGETTRASQAGVVAELARLIEEANEQSRSEASADNSQSGESPPSEGGSGVSPSTGAASQSRSTGPSTGTPQTGVSGLPDGPPYRNREGMTEESSERLPEETSQRSIEGFRTDLVHDVWGHLPQRLRDQLLNVGSDRYLPQYDSLVRRYFETLAQPEASQ